MCVCWNGSHADHVVALVPELACARCRKSLSAMPMEKSRDFIRDPLQPWSLPAVLPDLSVLEWNYVAEGNNNIVFGNDFTAIVLRILKDKDRSPKRDCSPYENEVEEQWEYFCHIIRPLLARSSYLLDGKLIPISDSLVADLAEKMQKIRPKFRSMRGISNAFGKAFIYPHLAVLHSGSRSKTLCIEIKPKWGFLTKVRTTKKVNSVKEAVCRFCMHQELKFSRGEVAQLSSYCPLDLFAGCTCRVKHALKSLLNTPQNNLRIFMDGNLIFGGRCAELMAKSNLENLLRPFFALSGEGSSVDHLITILTTVFAQDSHEDEDYAANDNHVDGCWSIYPKCPKTSLYLRKHEQPKQLCKPFGQKGVFSILQPLQKMGGVDIEDIHPIYSMLVDKREKQEQLRNYGSIAWQDVVNELTSCLSSHSGFDKEFDLSISLPLLCRFLVASTFRDCSLMISLHESSSVIKGPRTVHDPCSGKLFVYKVHITDLDPKDPRRLPQYLKMDREIVDHYLSLHAEMRVNQMKSMAEKAEEQEAQQGWNISYGNVQNTSGSPASRNNINFTKSDVGKIERRESVLSTIAEIEKNFDEGNMSVKWRRTSSNTHGMQDAKNSSSGKLRMLMFVLTVLCIEEDYPADIVKSLETNQTIAASIRNLTRREAIFLRERLGY